MEKTGNQQEEEIGSAAVEWTHRKLEKNLFFELNDT